MIETGEGGQKALHLPSQFNGVAQPAISLSDKSPLKIEDMPPRALELSTSLPFMLFIGKYRVPSGSKLPDKTFVQNSKTHLILMFRSLTDAQRKVESTPWLRHGSVLVDWRRAHQIEDQKIQIASQAPVESFQCATCEGLTLGSDVFVEPNSHSRLCRKCFEATEFWTQAEATRSQERVVDLLRMMAENDDVCVPRNIVRKVLKERWPADCASRGQAALWIEGAIDAGIVIETKRSDTKAKILFLPENSALALLPHPREDINTSEEEAFVENLLWEKGGSMDRKELNAALEEKFPQQMNTPIMRTKMYLNAAAKQTFFVVKGPRSQAVGLSKEDASNALEVPVEDIMSSNNTDSLDNSRNGNPSASSVTEGQDDESIPPSRFSQDNCDSVSSGSTSCDEGLEWLIRNKI